VDGVALILEAQAAGLRVSREAEKLVIRGPKHAAPIARKLLAHKAEVLAALSADPFSDLPPNDPAYRPAWRRWFNLLVQHKAQIGRRSLEEARQLAYGEAECLWHARYGRRPDPHLCAGCDGPVGSANIFALPDGARVHDDAGLACLTSYGDRWRTAAAEALRALGICDQETK
jgi:hypothetical protein